MSEGTLPKSKNYQLWMPIAIAVFMVLGMLVGVKLQPQGADFALKIDSSKGANGIGQGKIEELIRYIDARYVDDVKRDDLVKDAINALLKTLDPHSVYFTVDELKSADEQMNGSFEGIGVEFMIAEDTILIVTALQGGPSAIAGVLPGDKIVGIGDSLRIGDNIKIEDALKKLKGVKGSVADLRIQRGKKIIPIKVKRDVIPVQSLEVAQMLDKEIGIIKINRFMATTYNEFMDALTDLHGQGLKHLILDLRNNPGGYLQEATQMLNQMFDEKGKLLVYTEGRNSKRNEYKSTGRNEVMIDNLAILIDEGSASASEIVAGAIQDWDRGIVVGRRSFGKGLVQEQYKMSDGSAIRLTVARYYTPSGRCIQKDYSDFEAYKKDIEHRLDDGELFDTKNADLQTDTSKFFTSTGRVVYGGGGVSPDFFIPLDTLSTSAQFIQLRALIDPFLLSKKGNSTFWPSFQKVELFDANFQVDDAVVEALLNYGEKQNIEKKPLSPKMKAMIKDQIKQRIGRQLFDKEGFYYLANKVDPMIMKAKAQLLKADPFAK